MTAKLCLDRGELSLQLPNYYFINMNLPSNLVSHCTTLSIWIFLRTLFSHCAGSRTCTSCSRLTNAKTCVWGGGERTPQITSLRINFFINRLTMDCQPFQLLPSRNIWRHISLTCPSPVDTVTPHGLLMLRNSFLNFTIEHWFGCRTTSPGILAL